MRSSSREPDPERRAAPRSAMARSSSRSIAKPRSHAHALQHTAHPRESAPAPPRAAPGPRTLTAYSAAPAPAFVPLCATEPRGVHFQICATLCHSEPRGVHVTIILVCIGRVRACCAHLFVAPCPRRGARPAALATLPSPLLALRPALPPPFVRRSFPHPRAPSPSSPSIAAPLLRTAHPVSSLFARALPRTAAPAPPFPLPVLQPAFPAAPCFRSPRPRLPVRVLLCPCQRRVAARFAPVDAAPRLALLRLLLPCLCPPLLSAPFPLSRSLFACALSFCRLPPALAPPSPSSARTHAVRRAPLSSHSAASPATAPALRLP